MNRKVSIGSTRAVILLVVPFTMGNTNIGCSTEPRLFDHSVGAILTYDVISGDAVREVKREVRVEYAGKLQLDEREYVRVVTTSEQDGKKVVEETLERLGADGFYVRAPGDDAEEQLSCPLPLKPGVTWDIKLPQGTAQYKFVRWEDFSYGDLELKNCARFEYTLPTGNWVQHGTVVVAPGIGRVLNRIEIPDLDHKFEMKLREYKMP